LDEARGSRATQTASGSGNQHDASSEVLCHVSALLTTFRFLAAYSATRVFTSFRTSAAGKGLSAGKLMVPLLVS
ncbi:MAG TPA: hypothetical protein VLQ90_03435, partial [Pyrinomonadaceae bacterium]|nr:hypothetical protein [Pyrinomonadaceae bacterium]